MFNSNLVTYTPYLLKTFFQVRNRTGSGGGGVQLLTASYHRQIQSRGLYTVRFREFVGLLVLKEFWLILLWASVLHTLDPAIFSFFLQDCFKFWVWAPFGLVILLY